MSGACWGQSEAKLNLAWLCSKRPRLEWWKGSRGNWSSSQEKQPVALLIRGRDALFAARLMGDSQGWSESPFDVFEDPQEPSPLPAPCLRPAGAARVAQAEYEAAQQEEKEEEEEEIPSNPFTKAHFNYVVRQSQKNAKESKFNSQQSKPVPLPNKQKSESHKKVDPIRAAFAKQAQRAPQTTLKGNMGSGVKPKTVPGRSFFRKPSSSSGKRKTDQMTKVSQKLKSRKPLSPPLCSKSHSAPDAAFPSNNPSSSDQCPSPNSLGQSKHARTLSQTESVYTDAHPAIEDKVPSFKLSSVQEPNHIFITPPSRSCSAFSPEEEDLTDPAFADLFSVNPAHSHTSYSQSFTRPQWLDSDQLPAAPAPSYLQQPVIGQSTPNLPLKRQLVDLDEEEHYRPWSTFRKPRPPQRSYADTSSSSAVPTRTPRGPAGSLPGLVPSCTKSDVRQTKRLRAFEPPMPLSQWRAEKRF